TGEHQLKSFCLICVTKFVQVIYCNLPNLKQKTAGANPNGLLRNAINGHLVLVADNSVTW
uniref:hypothetical protein n=1 Tax=Limosilactobacillus viscerum TaxID=2993450 RepID=UPI0024BB72CC